MLAPVDERLLQPYEWSNKQHCISDVDWSEVQHALGGICCMKVSLQDQAHAMPVPPESKQA